MARIRRKPVSSAFYADDFPTVFSLGPALPPSPKNTETFASKETSLRPNSPLDPQSHLDESTLNESQTELLNGHRQIKSKPSGLVASVLRSKTKDNHIENVCELPGDSYYADGIGNEKHHSASARKLWNPFWLRKSTLSGFIVLYVLFLVCVAVLWRISRDQNGFTPHISTNRYTWTYGPTAVLIVVVSLWRQVQYYCAILAPWHEMKRGAEASRSLLLDYVSPFQFSSLWLAVRHGTVSVIAAILGFACLKLVIIFSTGLFVLSPAMVINSTYPIEITAAFNGSGFNASSVELSTDNPFSASGPVYAFYGRLANNLTLPVGAKDYLAYTPFQSTRNLPPKSSLSSKVDVLLPQFDCETAKVTTFPIRPDPYGSGFEARATFEAQSCTVEDVWLRPRDPIHSLCPPKHLKGQSYLIDCETKIGANSLANDEGVQTDFRFFVAITDFRYTQPSGYSPIPHSVNQTQLNETEVSLTIAGNYGVICKPSYSMAVANVTYNTSSQDESHRFSVATAEAPSGQTLENFSNSELSIALETALHSSMHGLVFTPHSLEPEEPDIVSRLMLLREGESSLQVFLDDTEVMKRAATRTFNGIASQYAQQSLLKPIRQTSTGHLIYPEDRLKVQTTSMVLIVTCLVLLVILTAVILVSRPYDVVPRKPDSMAGLSLILSGNPSLQILLVDLARSPTSTLLQYLSAYRFSSWIDWDSNRGAVFRVDFSKSGRVAETMVMPPESQHWHRPLSIKRGCIAMMLILPLIVIGILEGLQQASDRNDGFLTLPGDASQQNGSTTVLIRYIPALFMLLVATLFNMFDFTVSSFTPCSSLRIGSSPARRSIFSRLLGELPPVALYRAATEHHWGALFSNVAGLVGSLLAIIVSGLLIVENVSIATPVNVQQLDSFSIDTYNPADLNATATLGLIEQFNLSFPVFTYENLAFPRIKLSQDFPFPGDASNETSDTSLSVRLPALRASLDCTVLSQDDITFSFELEIPSDPEVMVSAETSLPEGCGGATTKFFFRFQASIDKESTYYVPELDNGWSFRGGIVGLEGVDIQSSECPSLAIGFGSFKMDVTSHENVTVMICSEHIHEVQTTATFNLPNLSIDTFHPPIVDEATARLLKNTTSGLTALQYSVPEQFNTNFVHFSSADAHIYDRRPLDPFFQAVTVGSDGIPPDQLLGPANANTLITATNHLYTKYMAQVINSDMRTAPLYPNPIYNATISQLTTRLKQNKGSKVTLQILLGVMFVCGALAYHLTPDLRHTIQHNPHTLAGTMSLLAGSEMCSRAVVPEGAEWMSDEELKKAGIFDGYLFSLGWWLIQVGVGKRTGKKRFGVDIGRAEKA